MKFRKSVIALVLSVALVLPSAAFAAEMDMMDSEMKEMKEMDMMDMSDAYKGVNKMTKGGMEYIELRQLANNLGYVLEWNAMMREVMMTTTVKEDMMSKHIIKLKVGVESIMVNNMKHDITFKPMIIKGRTYVTKAFADVYIVKMMK